MPDQTMRDGMRWFKKSFGAAVETATAGTRLSLNLLTVIAVQETYGEVWGRLYSTHSVDEILRLCVGDTIDGPRRRAFPVDKAALLAWPQGEAMFAVARQALEDLGKVNPQFGKIAVAHPDKFCHAFGIFQRDLQFFKFNQYQDYFLQQKWADFATSLGFCISELVGDVAALYDKGGPPLTHEQSVYSAIAYNTGPKNVDVTKGFRQGYKDQDGIYYGEYIDRYLTIAEQVLL